MVVACGLLALSEWSAAAPADAQAEFRRGLTALHEFEYEEANERFRRAQAIDPGFVPAYWGEVMTYHQSLWRHENVEAARQVLGRLGPSPRARAAKCRTPKEADLLQAVEILFGRGDPESRRRDYADAMSRVQERYADDPDITALYALALLGTTSRGLAGSADVHEGHSEGLAGSDTQARVAAVLQAVLKAHPDHRGALHYLIHTYDDPKHAPLALDTARIYATIAEASHALHMPSHIFLQLGRWHDAAASDRAAYDASSEWVRRKGLGDALRNYHALAWLEYELLQMGRYREAWQTIGEIEPVVNATGQLNLLSDRSSMRARYVVETRRWDLMAGERTFGNVNELFAIGISAARTANRDAATRARQALAERAQAEQEGDLRPAIAIMERELSALNSLTAGDSTSAVSMLQSAARAELALPAPFGLPEPIKPAPELLGEVLLELGRPREAIEWFVQALERNANRSLSIAGLARAAAALGQTDDARRRYGELSANFNHADTDLPELAEARAALETATRPAARPRPAGLLLSLSALASIAAAIAAVAGIRKWRTRASAAPTRGRGQKKKRR